ncbi:MAG: DinB family protein [Armatimonadota bacterium]
MNPAIELSKLTAVQGMDMFLRNFSYVPDDKLNWSPTPTSKSALRVAAHTAVTNSNFADFIRNRKLPAGDDIPGFVARTAAAEAAITSREEMERVFRENTQKVLDALDMLSDEDVEIVFDSGMSMKFLMRLAGWHATLHLGQIDYLQTCWGDQQIYTG